MTMTFTRDYGFSREENHITILQTGSLWSLIYGDLRCESVLPGNEWWDWLYRTVWSLVWPHRRTDLHNGCPSRSPDDIWYVLGADGRLYVFWILKPVQEISQLGNIGKKVDWPTHHDLSSWLCNVASSEIRLRGCDLFSPSKLNAPFLFDKIGGHSHSLSLTLFDPVWLAFSSFQNWHQFLQMASFLQKSDFALPVLQRSCAPFRESLGLWTLRTMSLGSRLGNSSRVVRLDVSVWKAAPSHRSLRYWEADIQGWVPRAWGSISNGMQWYSMVCCGT